MDVILKKYECLVKEWNTMVLAISIYFSAATIGLALGLIASSWITVVAMLAIMACFAAFELKIRRAYVVAKADIERQLGIKKGKEIIRKGLFW
jgi:hypothetical protein